MEPGTSLDWEGVDPRLLWPAPCRFHTRARQELAQRAAITFSAAIGRRRPHVDRGPQGVDIGRGLDVSAMADREMAPSEIVAAALKPRRRCHQLDAADPR